MLFFCYYKPILLQISLNLHRNVLVTRLVYLYEMNFCSIAQIFIEKDYFFKINIIFYNFTHLISKMVRLCELMHQLRSGIIRFKTNETHVHLNNFLLIFLSSIFDIFDPLTCLYIQSNIFFSQEQMQSSPIFSNT